MNRRPAFVSRLSPFACLLALACSDGDLPTEPDAGPDWTVAANIETTESDPFVLATITVSSTPADTAYIHLTVESPDFDPLDFVALRLPEMPGTAADSLTILGELPIWTDWLLVVDIWSQHAEVQRDSVLWRGMGEAPAVGQAPVSAAGFRLITKSVTSNQ